MSQYRRSEIVSGLFIVLAAVVFALFAFKVGRFDVKGLFGAETVRGRTYFLDVKTLQAGSKVRVGGRNVGEVVGVRLVDGPWPMTPEPGDDRPVLHRLINEVSFELSSAELRLDPETARVSIAQESLLAPHFLRLDPGQWRPEEPARPIFEAGLDESLIVRSGEGGGIDELLAIAQPALEELIGILKTVNREVLSAENIANIGGMLDNLDSTLEEGRQAATTLNRELLAPENTAALSRTVASLEMAVADGRAVAARLDAILDPERDPRIDRALTDLSAMTAELRDSLATISGELEGLIGTADVALVDTQADLAEATRRLQRALWQAEMAFRKIRANPAVLLFGDDETDLEARDLDLTDLRLRGRARPYEQRDEKKQR